MELQDYFKNYRIRRATFLDEEQFSSILLMFPAMLVGLADGKLDVSEKHNLAASIKEVIDDDLLLGFEMYSELIYLMFADTQTQNEALECLKELVVSDAEMKLAVAEIMTAMAEASGGMTAGEEKKIKELRTYLSIV
ncbi:MAG: hypothetical protein LBO69_01470 [Ignavibacteria bacterium]|jgi:tellurite resistance protein|nr:hypothetical protein [Ignavibacteria bacterium]